MDLERSQFPRWAALDRPLDASKNPIAPSPRRYRRAFFISPNAKEQSQAMANAKLSLDKAVEDATKANSALSG
jgi:hypothetical protein